MRGSGRFGTVLLLVLGGFCGVGARGGEAPSSDGYRIEGGSATLGGGAVLESAGFRIEMGVLGGGTPRVAASGGALALGSGAVPAIAPVGEVRDVRFDAADTLRWSAGSAAATFAVYRGALGQPGVEDCFSGGLATPTATDGTAPPPGGGFAYLVTATDRLGREGTPGTATDGTPRSTPNCPD